MEEIDPEVAAKIACMLDPFVKNSLRQFEGVFFLPKIVFVDVASSGRCVVKISDVLMVLQSPWLNPLQF